MKGCRIESRYDLRAKLCGFSFCRRWGVGINSGWSTETLLGCSEKVTITCGEDGEIIVTSVCCCPKTFGVFVVTSSIRNASGINFIKGWSAIMWGAKIYPPKCHFSMGGRIRFSPADVMYKVSGL